MEDLAGKYTGSYKPAFIWGGKRKQEERMPWELGK